MVKTIKVPKAEQVKGTYAIAAFSRKNNGHIVDGEWFDYQAFILLVRSAVEESHVSRSFVGWEIEAVPRWIRWMLPRPSRVVYGKPYPTAAADRAWNKLTALLNTGDEK